MFLFIIVLIHLGLFCGKNPNLLIYHLVLHSVHQREKFVRVKMGTISSHHNPVYTHHIYGPDSKFDE